MIYRFGPKFISKVDIRSVKEGGLFHPEPEKMALDVVDIWALSNRARAKGYAISGSKRTTMVWSVSMAHLCT